MDGRGQADAADLGELLDARGDVDAVAEDVAILENDVAEIDADAEFYAPVGGDVGIAPPHAVLDLDRRAHGVGDALKLDQHAVTRRLDDAAAVLVDHRIDQLDAMGAQPRERAAFVQLHEPAVADHVRGHDGSEAVFHASRSRFQ